MTCESPKTVVNSLVVSKVDYCNSLLAACTQQQTDKLQRVLNCATRVILGGSKYDHVTPQIRNDLHWLRVPERITFQLCLLVYKALHGLALVYIKSMCVPVSSSTARSSLQRQGAISLFHALGSSSASVPLHLPVQQLGTVYLTLYEALNPLTLSKDYLNPFYFQSHTLAFHSQLQHVIPFPCINLCNVPL